MLLEKYEPKRLADFIGGKPQIASIKNWIASWKKGSSLIIFGPTGVGKSLAVRLIAKDLGYDLIESHASDDRKQKNFSEMISSTKQHGVFMRKKIMLIDEVDMFDSTKPINEIINVSDAPVILIADDPYSKKLYNIRRKSKLVKFEKPRNEDVVKFLADLCRKEDKEYSDKDLIQLVRMNNGDIRSSLVDMECFGKVPLASLGQREQHDNIFNVLKIILKTKSIENARMAMHTYDDIEELISSIAENVSEEYRDIYDLAAAYNYLSKADVFHSRIIKRQSWGLQKYFFDLSVYGVANAKRSVNAGFVSYKIPRYYYGKKSVVLQKIGRKLHTSSKKSVAYIPIIKKELKSVSKKFGFDEDDIEEIKSI